MLIAFSNKQYLIGLFFFIRWIRSLSEGKSKISYITTKIHHGKRLTAFVGIERALRRGMTNKTYAGSMAHARSPARAP